ncbi:MAG TPA: T9SS type A sorting domain-containing protein [Bacteroidia bacterium]|nr:T9SS type A sorting domain-containing protein [Bacteroidia bacterium]
MQKKYFLFIIIMISAMLNSPAQTITSFTVVPPNPTSADTVKIYVQCDFPNSNCNGATYLNGINGSVIDAGGLHCMGSLTALCTDIDTVILPPLSPGQYTLNFLLVTGVTAGCIPNIVPIVMDSAHFTVSGATGIYDLNPDNKELQITPNPSDGKFTVRQIKGEKSEMKIFSAEGRLMSSFLLADSIAELNFTFPQGIYTIIAENKERRFFSKLVVVK